METYPQLHFLCSLIVLNVHCTMLLVFTSLLQQFTNMFFVSIFQGMGGLNGEPGRQGKDGLPVRT